MAARPTTSATHPASVGMLLRYLSLAGTLVKRSGHAHAGTNGQARFAKALDDPVIDLQLKAGFTRPRRLVDLHVGNRGDTRQGFATKAQSGQGVQVFGRGDLARGMA